jgi:hypothetical protein
MRGGKPTREFRVATMLSHARPGSAGRRSGDVAATVMPDSGKGRKVASKAVTAVHAAS